MNLWTFFNPENWLAGEKQLFPCLDPGLEGVNVTNRQACKVTSSFLELLVTAKLQKNHRPMDFYDIFTKDRVLKRYDKLWIFS